MKSVVVESCQVDIVDNLVNDEIINQIYHNRGIRKKEELDYSIINLLPPTFSDIDKLCIRLENALIKQEKITIVGDFDVDGATSVCLTILSLREMGFKNISYIIPDRNVHGYGLGPDIVDLVIKEHQANIILTVDNGISSFEGVDYANEHNIDVLITDHHLSLEKLPNAYAIVNPNRPLCEFPSKCIAGVGVAFYVMSSVCSYLRKKGLLSNSNFFPTRYLDLVAIGTIADLVNLDYNNRILVFQGIARINSGNTLLGIKAIAKVINIDLKDINNETISFAISPLINAAGRMASMDKGVSLLLSTNEQESLSLVNELDCLNKKRREIQDHAQFQIDNSLNRLNFEQYSKLNSICSYNNDWNQGIIGLLAARICETTYKPCFVFTDSGEINGRTVLKASGRSIDGIHLKDVIDLISKENPGLLIQFGGHAMAAGLSLYLDNFSAFRKALIKTINGLVEPNKLGVKTIYYDMELDTKHISKDLFYLINRHGPWGKEFELPIFYSEFILVNQKMVGKNKNSLNLSLMDKYGKTFNAIYFKVDDKWPNPTVKTAKVFYKLSVNNFRGSSNVSLIVQHIEPVYESSISINNARLA